MNVIFTRCTGTKTIKKSSPGLFFGLIFLSFFLHPVQYFAQGAPVKPAGTQHQKVPGGNAGLEDLLHHFDREIYFTENKGQWDPAILYKAEFPLGKAIATKSGMFIRSFDAGDVAAYSEQDMRREEAERDHLAFTEPLKKVKSHAWQIQFAGTSPAMSIRGKSAHKDPMSFFGLGATKNASKVLSYQEIWYDNVYDKVDVRYYPSESGELEYDIVCKPGFNKDAIALRFEGVGTMKLTATGELVLATSIGDMTLPRPYAYQKINGKQVEVKSEYVLNNKNVLSFKLGAFDPMQPLVIDPIAVRWATWINSNSGAGSGSAPNNGNHGHCIWVDETDRAIYVAARPSTSTNNITTGALDNSFNGDYDLLVGKYYQPDSIGGAGTRVWQTYIGGGSTDNPYAMEMGPDGNIYLTGNTSSTDFPLIAGSAFGSNGGIDHRSQGGNNIFVMKINKEGTAMKAAVFGGNGSDQSYDLRITPAGDIVVCGSTASTNLNTQYPNKGAVNSSSNNGTDVLIFKINQALTTVQWVKNYGGSHSSSSSKRTDVATIMSMNPANGDIFVGGHTVADNFPVTSNARQNSLGGTRSGFLQKLKSDGSVVWSSYFRSASSKVTSILCMEFNTLRNRIYFGGISSGLESPANIPASGTYDNSYNGGDNDFFVACMDTSQSLINSTYIGGSANEGNMMGLNVDLNNDVYVFGYSNSTNFPTTSDALQTKLNTNGSSSSNNDKVFLKIGAELKNAPIFSTYYGGLADDYDPVGERGIKFSDCRIYTIVTAQSDNIPLTEGALNTSKSSSTSVYEPGLVVWANPPDLLNNTITGSQTICAGAIPTGLTGSVPSYSLAKISRKGTVTTYPVTLNSATTYEWQMSTDSINWTPIPNSNTQNLAANKMVPLFQKTYYRRIIGGDACVIAGAADQCIKIKVLSVPGEVTNVSCYGFNNGKIKAMPDGTPPYTYSWTKNGNPAVISTSQTISNLEPGTYKVLVKDGSNCSASNTFTITQPAAPLSATTSTTTATCGGNNGSATATPAGGTAPYTYLWSNNATIATASGLGANVYTVTVKDKNGCEFGPVNAIVGNISNLAISVGTVNPVKCFGENNGSFSVVGTNGSTPYKYSFNNGAFGSTSSFSNLAPGSYPVAVKDNVGCISSTVVTISQPDSALSASIGNVTHATCPGQPGGSATVSAAGGTAPYSYVWSPSGGTGATANGLVPGDYSVQVKDAKNCTVPALAVSISSSDTQKPTWTTVPGALNITVACGDAQALVNALAMAPFATDNCDSITYLKKADDFVPNGCSGSGSYTNTWIAKDLAGNESGAYVQTITVNDNVKPVISACASSKQLNTNASCKATVPDLRGEVSASDNCTASENLVITQSPAAGSLVGPGTTDVTITVKDACNNQETCTTTLYVIGPIEAKNDAGSNVNGFAGGTSLANVLVNDKLNCTAVVPSEVTLSFVSSTHPGIALSGTSVKVAAGTPAGSYSLVYKICEVANATNCDEATVTVPVTAASIAANDDAGTAVNGYTGGISFTNVLTNDKLNGAPVNPAHVELSFVSSTHPAISLSGTDVHVAPGTPAGNYSLVYKICDKINPLNCDEATVSVPVSAPSIDAVNDAGSPVNGYAGGTSFSNVLANDKLNGVTVHPAEVVLSFVSATHAGVTLSGADVLVAPGTPAGSYNLKYKICEILNPANCDQATVSVPVTTAAIKAKNDAGGTVNGFTGGTGFTNVLGNDKLNGAPVNPSEINLSFVSSTHTGITLSGANVLVAPGTPSGPYSLTYKICEKLNPANCDQAVVTMEVSAQAPVANKGTINDCYDNLSAAEAAAIAATTVTPGNCAGEVSKTASTTGTCQAEITVTVSDNCGNNAQLTYSTRIDGQAPVWTTQANALHRSVSCSDGAALIAAQALAPVAGDNCGQELSYDKITGSFVAGSCGATGSYTNTWTAKDACGNTSTVFTQVISVIDETAPVWSTAPGAINRSVSCDDAAGLAAAQALEPAATDNCGSVTYTRTPGEFVAGVCGGTYNNTWVAKDACLNASTVFTQVITITDTQPPVWSTTPGSLNVSLSCSDATGIAAALSAAPVAADQCGNVSYEKMPGVFVPGACPQAGTYTNTWVAKDACNNVSSMFTQVVTLIDNVEPVIGDCPADSHVTANANCKAPVPDFTALLTAEDNCTAAGNLVISQSPAAGSLIGPGMHMVVLTVKDACGNAASCTTAVKVTGPIVANDDAGNNVNGFTGGVSLANVLANDLLNCSPVNPAAVMISFVSSTHPGISLSGAGVHVAPGTPVGSYSLVYKICEVANATNCDEATVSIPVTAATIVANDDAGSDVNGFTGGVTFSNVLSNDLLNGLAVNPADVQLSFVSATHPGVTLSGSDVHVAPGTSSGSYSLVYKICEKLNPANCDEATVSVPVKAARIIAKNDAGVEVNGYVGGISFSNVLVNDKLNGAPASPAQISLSFVSSTHAGITLSGTDVHVAPGIPAGSYSLKYKICELLNPANCDEATVSVPVGSATMLANNDIGGPMNGYTGGTGFTNVLANDKLNGAPVNPAEVNLSFVSSSHAGITLSGADVLVAPGTPAGPHSLTYKICEKLNPSNCDEADVILEVLAQAPVATKGSIDDCYDNLQAAEAAAIAATTVTPGNCTGEVSKTASTTGSCEAMIIVTVSDNCGNSGDVIYTTRIDGQKPLWITQPGVLNRYVYCGDEDALAAAQALAPVATDNCDQTLQYEKTSGAFTGGCGVTGSYTNTWIVKDACGNASDVYTQQIWIFDTSNPAWVTAPGSLNRTVAYNDEAGLAAAQALQPEATDNCSSFLTYTRIAGRFVGRGCSGTYTNKWIAKDACDNQSMFFIQVITVTGSQPPVWATPAGALDRLVECGNQEALAAAQALAPEIVGDGNGITIHKTTGALAPLDGGGTYTNTWIAKDACNNVSNVYQQVITVMDASNPVISQAGPHMTITCPETPVFTPPTATDNCDPNPEIILWSTATSPVSQVTGVYTITKKWYARDASGNVSGYRWQTITVNPLVVTEDKAICQGSSYTFYGLSYSVPGTYVRVLTHGGCNVLATLNLMYAPAPAPAASINASSVSVISGTSVALTAVGELAEGAVWKWYAGGCGNGQSIGTGAGIVVQPAATTTYYVRAESACGVSVCVEKTITLEPAGSCSAHEVISFSQGKRKDLGNITAARSNPEHALHTPQYNDAQNAPINFVSLGFGGELVLKFQNPIANGPGNDLRVVETSHGDPSCSSYKEKVRVYVSQDGVSYHLLGEGCLNSDFNLDEAGLPWAQYVKLTDISNRSDFSAADADGYDVDGIECLNGEAQIGGCHAAYVKEVKQGKTAGGANVPAVRSNTEFILGPAEPTVTGVVNFFSLGFGGHITLEMADPVANGPGPDIRVDEATWENPCPSYPEKADVFASQDGTNFVYLGRTCQDGEFDLGPLSWARFIRIVDASNPADFASGDDGFDVAGIECLNGTAIELHNDELISCSLQEAISYNPGKRKNGTDILPERSNPEKALGMPQNDNSDNFVSLGFGGEFIGKFDYVIFNRPGNDLRVVETTIGGQFNCTNYPEHAEVSASLDGLSWTVLGDICWDGSLDLGSLPYAQFIRIKDTSPMSSSGFDGLTDGYDIDGVIALQDGCSALSPRMGEEEEMAKNGMPKQEIFVDMYPNPAKDQTVVSFKGLQQRGNFIINVFDASGRLVRREKIAVDAAMNTHTLNTGEFAPGVLVVLISGENLRFMHRLVKE